MILKLTASNLIAFISRLSKKIQYPYISSKTKTLVLLDGVTQPEGPISIVRYNPNKNEKPKGKRRETISAEMLWRVANAIRPNVPFNIDRILGASYNTRSALETLIANTPQFYYCYPGRVERISDMETIKPGHKHLIWCPNEPHEQGLLFKKDIDMVISEIPQSEVIYDSVTVMGSAQNSLDIEIDRRHAQIQIALYLIGLQLGYRTWIAQNDKGIMFRQKRLCEYQGVVSDLRDERLLSAFDESIQAALLIDCIWFKNGRLMPAVMEIEHSTGVRSGLLRMQKFKECFAPFPSRWVIVAPDADRDLVMRESQAPQFANLSAKFFPYSSVEELYSLCSRRKISGITEEFLDSFMENTLS